MKTKGKGEKKNLAFCFVLFPLFFVFCLLFQFFSVVSFLFFVSPFGDFEVKGEKVGSKLFIS